MSFHRKLTALGVAGALSTALALVLTASASALCGQNCPLPPPPPPPPPPSPPPLALTGSQVQGVPPQDGVWTLSTRVGGSNQLQPVYDVDSDVGSDQIGLTTFTATGPGSTPVTVTGTDTQICESLLSGPEVVNTTPYTASGTGRATVSMWPDQTCPAGYMLSASVQKAYATQGSLTTPTATFAWTFDY